MDNIFEMEPHHVRQLSDEQLMQIQKVHKIEQCLIYEIYRLRDRNKFLEAAAHDTAVLTELLASDGIPSWQIAAVREALTSPTGGKIKAIKQFRELTGMSLKNAKFVIDRLQEKIKQEENERREQEEADSRGEAEEA